MKRREIWVKISIRPNMVLKMRDFFFLIWVGLLRRRKERKEEEKRRDPGLEIDIG